MYLNKNKNAIKETVNKNIEKNQTPYWRAHNTMKGLPLFKFPLCINTFFRMGSNELSKSSHEPKINA